MSQAARALVMAWLVALVTVSTAGSQTPSQASVQVISGSEGYQFSLPSTWQRADVSIHTSGAGGTTNVVQAWESADGISTLLLQIANSESAARLDPAVLFPAAISGAQASSEAAGGSALKVFAGPDPVNVPSAGSAVGGAAVYSDGSGNRVLTLRIATRGNTAYIFIFDVPQDFYNAAPAYGQILGSFQLTATAATGAGATP